MATDKKNDKVVYFIYVMKNHVEGDSRHQYKEVKYVGRGSWARYMEDGRSDEVNAWMLENPNHIIEAVEMGLSNDRSIVREAYWIKFYGLENLLNQREELTDKKFWIAYNEAEIHNTPEDIYDSVKGMARGCDRITPVEITDEWMSIILDKFNDTDKLKVLDPYARYGGITGVVKKSFPCECNITLCGDKHSLALGMYVGDIPDMKSVSIYNEDFLESFNTNEKFDVIFLNPPFKKVGQKFILKCADLLKDGGYLCCVMSPYWRSLGSNNQQRVETAYTDLLDTGGFISIHMYSGKETAELFGQNIGQIDTFVWQKGITHTATNITNINGNTFTADLSKYIDTPPVFDCELYDTLFDQKNGIGYKSFTNPRNTGVYGPSKNIGIIDVITGKLFDCNDANIQHTKGKKIVIDRYFNKYYVDNTGDVVINDYNMFFFDTDEERDRIVYVLEYLLSSGMKELVMNRSSKVHAYIPKIRVK